MGLVDVGIAIVKATWKCCQGRYVSGDMEIITGARHELIKRYVSSVYCARDAITSSLSPAANAPVPDIYIYIHIKWSATRISFDTVRDVKWSWNIQRLSTSYRVRRRWPSIARKLSRLLTEEVERIGEGELKKERERERKG